LTLIQKLVLGDWQDINAYIVALFNLMGVFPLVYASILASDGRGQKIPAWLFAASSFAVGAFALLPYMALREPNPEFVGQKGRLLKFWDSPWLGVAISAIAGYFIYYGFDHGDWADFVRQWQTNRFINVMSLDFCMLSLLFPWLLSDDMERRGMTDDRYAKFFTTVALIPLVGALIYLCWRSPLIEKLESRNISDHAAGL
jgi:hypothetical protein